MIPKNIKKIISYLLRNSKLSNINQISRELKISVGSAFKILKELEEAKIILQLNLGNAKYYKINFENKEAIKLCELILLKEERDLKGYAKMYADEIKNFKDADLIILFGSVLENKKFNDVDVLFVTNKIKIATEFCLGISKIRTKPVVGLIMKKEDLVNELKKDKQPILNVIKTGVVLKGEDVFLEVIKNARL